MNLKDYLKAITECPDEFVQYTFLGKPCRAHRLSVDFGISENFPIYMKMDFVGLVRYLDNNNKYKSHEPEPSYVVDAYGPQFYSALSSSVIMFISPMKSEIKQYLGYTASINLFPNQKKKIENIPWQRSIATVVGDIGQFILDENIPALMPYTIGWKYLDNHDDSMIVVHEGYGGIRTPSLRIKESGFR